MKTREVEPLKSNDLNVEDVVKIEPEVTALTKPSAARLYYRK